MEQIEQRNPCIMNATLGVREVYMFTITETRPFKNVDRENANKWKMTLI